jgi:hypothetical protein
LASDLPEPDVSDLPGQTTVAEHPGNVQVLDDGVPVVNRQARRVRRFDFRLGIATRAP